VPKQAPAIAAVRWCRCRVMFQGMVVSIDSSLTTIPSHVFGTVRSGASPYTLTPKPQGTLEFPRGARVRFRCNPTHRPTLIFEPIWLSMRRVDQRIHIEVTEHAPQGELSVHLLRGSITEATPEGERHWSIPAPSAGAPLMLRFGERWTARWWRSP